MIRPESGLKAQRQAFEEFSSSEEYQKYSKRKEGWKSAELGQFKEILYGLGFNVKADSSYNRATFEAEEKWGEYMDLGYSQTQIQRANRGVPHMSDTDYDLYLTHGKDYQSYRPKQSSENAIIDTLKKY